MLLLQQCMKKAGLVSRVDLLAAQCLDGQPLGNVLGIETTDFRIPHQHDQPCLHRLGTKTPKPADSFVFLQVCSVHPGRVLELNTTIGVSKMRHVISDYRYHQQVLDYSDGLPSGNRLKSGR